MATKASPGALSRLMERKRIPDKIYYSISEVSKYTGVEPHVLRYWETKR